MEIIDGRKISAEIKEEVKKEVEIIKSQGKRVPGLVTILVGNNPASQSYVGSKAKSCEELGMKSKIEALSVDISQAKLLDLIKYYNNNPEFDGILVQLPLPKHINEDEIIDSISPAKDVDGFHPTNVGKLVIGKDTFLPCTPAGIQELLKRYKISTKGKHLVVLGRSNLVGKPIANIMLQKKEYANAVVTICHSAAEDLTKHIRSADILVAAIGQPKFVKADMVKDGVVVIDVGINRVEDSTAKKGYKIVGDVDFENVAPKSSFITPVPGGVGLMTVAMLMKNTLKAYKINMQQIKK
jgi:methylenetetrahydrofolate dehydrogenase (NADP+)/methenyltetrahydrofolate cyclohydrolase